MDQVLIAARFAAVFAGMTFLAPMATLVPKL
ncbi:Uncharacterised protein [Mycobacteroides abscessus subsp. abscessus]|nr:Uncharacterised protein [Mycobacteroides abscessus subsp. abscessus]